MSTFEQEQYHNTVNSKCQQYRQSIRKQVFKLALFIILTVLIASLISGEKALSGYSVSLSSKKMINKSMRGVFPPLEGSIDNLTGKWKAKIYISKEKVLAQQFKNYTLQFFKNNQIKIKNELDNCNHDKEYYIFDWRIFSYNILISDGIKIMPIQPDNSNKQNSPDSNTVPDPGNSTENQQSENNPNNNYVDNYTQTTNSTNNQTEEENANPARNLAMINSTFYSNTTNTSEQDSSKQEAQQEQTNENTDQNIPSLPNNLQRETEKTQKNENEEEKLLLTSTGKDKKDLNKLPLINCFSQEDEFIDLLNTFTVWTIFSQNLFILSETGDQQAKRTAFLVFTKL